MLEALTWHRRPHNIEIATLLNGSSVGGLDVEGACFSTICHDACGLFVLKLNINAIMIAIIENCLYICRTKNGFSSYPALRHTGEMTERPFFYFTNIM